MGQHQVTNKAGLVGWYDVHSDTFEPIVCDGCDQPFTQKAYDDAHWYQDGTYHDHCCPMNKGDDPEHGNFAEQPRKVIAMGYEVSCPVCAHYFTISARSEDDKCPACGVLLDTSGGIHDID